MRNYPDFDITQVGIIDHPLGIYQCSIPRQMLLSNRTNIIL